MKKTLIAAVFGILCITANAQELRLGVTAGLNVNVARGGDPCGATLGYVFGGNVCHALSESNNSWYWGGSLLLSQKGYKQDNIFYTNDIRARKNLMI
ncbi:hypothetical protein [Prevotella sp. OH937_COT-195]|uniref:hypothetical protein n=1 Tax=Prevotella sp. OH937_COT-195 TaxID=2491051 RepID=UPI000F6558A9|nr:hypothetical protein [Prevotella sp. OH937_COT-195]RRD00969.1 hypothetical protein EII32_05950 [Prevotella sp. OH937_COT-195]